MLGIDTNWLLRNGQRVARIDALNQGTEHWEVASNKMIRLVSSMVNGH